MNARHATAPVKADDNGWAEGRIDPLPIDRAWSLFSPELGSRIDIERWADHAQRFFALRIDVTPKKAYPSGASPLVDAFDFEVAWPAGDDDVESARVITVPLDRAPQARAAALAIARGPMGGGFEALILRAKRLWQIAVVGETPRDARPALAAATVLASVLLAPILPPGEGVLFGVKTARERLERLHRGA